MHSSARTSEHSAAHWIARREKGLSVAERREFELWLSATGENAAAFHAMSATWRRLGRVRGSSVAARLEAELDELPRRRSTFDHARRAAWVATFAAAAAIVISIGWFASRRPSRAETNFTQHAATEVGQVTRLDLPDGSTLRLNTDTVLDVSFSKTARHVWLRRGEALFRVSKDPARPFIVNTEGIDVRAVGTAFAVRKRAAAVEVLVAEGKVRVDDAAKSTSLLAPRPAVEPSGPTTAPGDAPLLTAGTRVTIPTSTGVPGPANPVAVSPDEIKRALAWTEGRLVFVSAPLREMVDEFNRHNRSKLEIADPELAARRFGGAFDPDDPATFVELLRASHGIVVEELDGRKVLHAAPAARD